MTIKRLSHNGLLALVGLLALAVSVCGSEFTSGERVHITNLHRIDDDLYIAGSDVRVDGVIEGDLVVAGYEVRTSGEVSGSQNVAAITCVHDGRCRGSLRVFATACSIDGFVDHSAVLLGTGVVVGNRAVIRRDCTIGGVTAEIEGEVRGKLTVHADEITVSGRIGGDAYLEAERITLVPPAVIEGNLTYASKEELSLDSLGGVTILGSITRKETVAEDDASGAFRRIVLTVSKWLAAFIFGIILLHLFRRQAEESLRQIRQRFSVSLATGVLLVLVSALSLVVLLFVLVLTVIGLSLISGDAALVGAILLIFSIVMVPISTFATVSGGILFYVGKVVLGALIGYGLIALLRPGSRPLGKTQMLIGLIILYLLFALPYVGFLVYLLAGMAGGGSVVLGVRHCLRVDRERQPAEK